MKRIWYFSIFLLTAFATPRQPVPDSRLIDFLGQERVDLLLKTNPQMVYYYNFYLDNVWYLSDMPAAKAQSANIEGSLALPLTASGEPDTKKMNVLKLKIKRYFDHPSYYTIQHTHKLIVFRSEEDFNQRYNDFRRKSGLIKE